MEPARAYFNALNYDYLAVHKAKEDLFWATYMGTSDDHAGFTRAENAYKDFISDPERLKQTRSQLDQLGSLPPGPERDAIEHGLKGWLAVFEANVIESDEGRQLMHAIIEAESDLFARKRDLQPRHVNERAHLHDLIHGEDVGADAVRAVQQ